MATTKSNIIVATKGRITTVAKTMGGEDKMPPGLS